MRVKDLTKFIIARESLRVRKENDQKPWTKDPILAKYRFCNVHREDDYVTMWLREEYYPLFKDDPDVWFTAVVARLFNNPEALEAISGSILPFMPERMRSMLHSRKRLGKKNFNAAYIVSTNGVAMDKIDYVIYNILGLLWAERKNMRPKIGDTLDVYHKMLMGFDGLGSFIAAQVIADLKYIDGCPLKDASDWYTFAASGPGSRRGLNRLMERSVDAPWREHEWRATLLELQEAIKPLELHAQDLQNCLCEWDKFERARLGEGTPKQLYREKE